MKSVLATARLLFISAAWAALPFAAPLHGAEFVLPFTEDFQSQSFLDSAKTTARWTSSGVTLGHARGRHRAEFTPAPEDVFEVGNSSDNSDIDDIALRDMNGDGRLDIITAGDDGIFVFLAGEMNDLGTVQPVPVTATPSHILAFGDFEQDGDLDIVAAGRRVSLYRNSGQGSFDAGGDVVSLVAAGLAAADVDGDGHLDLVFARQGRSGAVGIHLNDGQGVFTEKTGAARQTGTFSRGLAVGDLDGDGDVDIAIGKFRNNNVYYLNDGGGRFGGARVLRQTQKNHPNNGVALGDVNNDGLLDIVVGGRRAKNLLYLNDGGGVFSTGTAVGRRTAVTLQVGLADLDGDGDLDLYEASLSGRGSFAYTNPGDGGYGMTGSRIGPKTNAVAVGDLNGDSAQDVVIGRNLALLDAGLGRNPAGTADAASAVRHDNARGRVVSRRIDIDGRPLHVVYFTATAAPSANTAIDYYLSNDGGNHWRRAYPDRIVRFLSPGNHLRWRAELRSHSPALSTTLTQIGVEGVLQVSIDGVVQRSGSNEPYRASSRTVGEKVEAVLRLENRSDRPLEITGIRFTGIGFSVENEPDSAILPGGSHNASLVFQPTMPGIHPSELTISSSESGSVLHQFDLPLRGVGFAAVIKATPRIILESRVGSSATQTVKVENEGNLGLKIEHPPAASTSRFVLIDPDPSGGFPLTITASESVNLKFRFKPEARGTVTGSVTFVSNAIGTTETITLEGKGVASEIDIIINGKPRSGSDSEYDFGRWPIKGTTFAEVIINNTSGDASLRIDSAAIDDERHFGGIKDELFPLPTIPAGSSMSNLFRLSFTPNRRGVQSTTLTVTSNAINGTQTITLRGYGEGAEIGVEVDGESLASGTTRHLNRIIKVGVATAVEVVLHNHGELPLEIESLALSNGVNKMDDLGFSGTIPPHSSTRTEIDFVLNATGTVVKTLEITSKDPITPTYRVMLTSTGIAPVMVVTVGEERRESGGAPYDFGDVLVGETASRTVVIRNDGDVPLEIRSVGAGPHASGFTVSSGHSTAVVEIGRSSSEQWTLHFEPSDTGAVHTGTLVIEHDTSSTTQPWSLGLRGQGVEPLLEVMVGGMTFTPKAKPTPINKQMNAAELLTTTGPILIRGSTDNHTEKIRIVKHDPTITILSDYEGASRNRMVVSAPSNLLNLRTPVNVELTTDIVVWNRGNSDLVVNPIGLVNPNNLLVGGAFVVGKVGHYRLSGDRTRRIPKNSSHTWVLHFTPPDAVTTYDGTIRIFSNDDKANPFTLNVRGFGTRELDLVTSFRGCTRMSGIHCEVDNVRVGMTTSVELIIANRGTDLLTGFVRLGRYSDPEALMYLPPGVVSIPQSPRLYIDYTMDGRRHVYESFMLDPGEYTTRTISFSPLDVNVKSPGSEPPERYARYWRGAFVRIGIDGPNERERLVGVWSKTIGPEMHVDIGMPLPVYVEDDFHSSYRWGVTNSLNWETRRVGYSFGDVMVGTSETVPLVIRNLGNEPLMVTASVSGRGYHLLNKDGSPADNQMRTIAPCSSEQCSSEQWHLRFVPLSASRLYGGDLTIISNDYHESYNIVKLIGNGISTKSQVSGTRRHRGRYLTSDYGDPNFVELGYADGQSRLWLAFDKPAQILTESGAHALADGTALSGFEVLPNYAGGDGAEKIGVLRSRYRSGGVVMDLARGIVPTDESVWVRYSPPRYGYGLPSIASIASRPEWIFTVRLFMLPRSGVLDYDGDGFPDALEARLGGNPLVADDVVGLPEVALLRAGAAGSPAVVAYSGIRTDGVATHLGVVTTGASSLAAYYLSDTFGYSGGYALGVGGYECTEQFPSDYALPVSKGGCAVVDFNSIRAGVEHRIGWLAANAAGYWAVAQGTASRLPEQVILRVPEFNMKRRNVFVSNSAAADATVRVGAFHDGPASSQSLTVSFSNVAAADSPSSSQPDGFSVSVAGVTTNITNYAITGVHSGEDSKLWLAGDPLSSLTPDKYSLGKVTQTGVVRLGDDNLPPLFGRASLYAVTTADENERHAVVVRGTESYIALLPVVQGSAQTASAFEVSPWGGAGGGPVAADDRIVAVNTASPAANGALVRIAFTASNPPAAVRNTVSLEVAASSAGADTATTVLTWPVIDSADALASIAGDSDHDGIPDVRDSYRLLNRLPISVAGGVSGYPDRSSAGAGSWHHIRPLLPLHNQFVGSYATRAGLSFHTDFVGDARILARLPVATSEGQAIAAPEGQSVLAATYQPGVPVQMNYADFAASLSRDEFDAMVEQSRRDIAVVYNFRLHGVEPSVAQAAQGATLSGGRAGVVIPLPESLRDHASILPLHYTNGAWSGFSSESDAPGEAGFAPLQAGACPDDSGLADSPYRTAGALNTRKRTGDACMVLYLTDGAAADRDGNLNGTVDALIGLAATAPPR